MDGDATRALINGIRTRLDVLGWDEHRLVLELDEYVHDTYAPARAARINNEGMPSQITALVAALGPAETRKLVNEILGG